MKTILVLVILMFLGSVIAISNHNSFGFSETKNSDSTILFADSNTNLLNRGTMRIATEKDFEIVNVFLEKHPDFEPNTYEHWLEIMKNKKLYLVYIKEEKVEGFQRARKLPDGTLYLTMFYMNPKSIEDNNQNLMITALWDWVELQEDINKVEFNCDTRNEIALNVQEYLFPTNTIESPVSQDYTATRTIINGKVNYVLRKKEDMVLELTEEPMDNGLISGEFADKDFEGCASEA